MDKEDAVCEYTHTHTHTHTHNEQYLTVKKKKKGCRLRQHGWTLEVIILSEVNQKDKDKYMIPLTRGIKNRT